MNKRFSKGLGQISSKLYGLSVIIKIFCPCIFIQFSAEILSILGKLISIEIGKNILLCWTCLWLFNSLSIMLGYIGIIYDGEYLGRSMKIFQQLANVFNKFKEFIKPILGGNKILLEDKNNRTSEYIKKNSIIIYLWFLCWWGNLYYLLTYLKVDKFHGLGNLLDGIYFSFITAFTIGYGDFYPCTWIGRLLVIFEISFNFLFLISIFQKVYSEAIIDRKERERDI